LLAYFPTTFISDIFEEIETLEQQNYFVEIRQEIRDEPLELFGQH